jgi:glycosyltransferase involved in cell wall biosynthesis
VDSPRVSVCIPVYNAERFIAASITSALAQHHVDFEVVVVDNASTDATPRVIAQFSDPRMRVYRNDRNIGAAGNFNRCVELARGRYLKILCADDVLYPDCLEKQAAALGDAGIALAGSARDIIDERGRVRLRRRFPRGSGRIRGDEAIRAVVRAGTNLFGEPAAVLVRTDAVRAAGGFDPRYQFCLDLDLWCRLLLAGGDLFMHEEALCGFRVSGTSWSTALARRQRHEFREFVADLEQRGVALSSFDRARSRARAWSNAIMRQAVTRMLTWSNPA